MPAGDDDGSSSGSALRPAAVPAAAPTTMEELEELGRVRLSKNFFMREMLYSELASFHEVRNIPDDPPLAVAAGRRLCEELLEPLHEVFGGVVVRSAFRSCTVNELGTGDPPNNHGCGETEWNHGRHIWDRRDADGNMGATVCVVLPWFLDRQATAEANGEPPPRWEALAWWIHDQLPYSDLTFMPRLGCFNIRWCEKPAKVIESWKINNRDGSFFLASPGKETPPWCEAAAVFDSSLDEDHSGEYEGFPAAEKATGR